MVGALSAGFVREIHVHDGQQVSKGQPLLVLESRELKRELADLDLQIRQSSIRSQRHEQKGEIAQKQAEAKNRERMRSNPIRAI